MQFSQKRNLTEVREVVEANIGIPIDEFLKDAEVPFVKNLDEAVLFVKNYMENNPDAKLWCVGDYDVDGLMASEIIEWTFKKLQVPIKVRIPHRMSEGYGLSVKIIDEIDRGLIITVDNGIAAIPAIKKAKEKGLLVVVIDHHLPVKDENDNMVLPPADVVVDPHTEDESTFKEMCGAELAYLFATKMLPDFHLYPLKVLASIATVTDVMPLIGYNRRIVKEGLELINKRKNVSGINALLDAKELSVVTEEDYGFLIGPIFNAPGRLMDNGGVKVLEVVGSKENNPALFFLVKALIDINEQRKQIVNESMVIAESLVTDERPIVIYHPSFGEGIVGIIAGQLTEKYNTPSIVFTSTEDGTAYKGSARSTPNIHLKNGLDKIRNTMLGYGGHAGAAGVSILPEKFDEFKQAFIESVGTEEPKGDELFYDLDITESNIVEMAEEVKKYAPYGEGNPKPTFHLKLDMAKGKYAVLGDGTHFSIDMGTYKVMGFGMVDKYTAMGSPKKIDAVCYVSEDWFGGTKSIRLELIDFKAIN